MSLTVGTVPTGRDISGLEYARQVRATCNPNVDFTRGMIPVGCRAHSEAIRDPGVSHQQPKTTQTLLSPRGSWLVLGCFGVLAPARRPDCFRVCRAVNLLTPDLGNFLTKFFARERDMGNMEATFKKGNFQVANE